MKFYKKASGTDIIPNKVFWKSVPFLIKVIKIPPPLLIYANSTVCILKGECKSPRSKFSDWSKVLFLFLQDGFVFTFGPCVRLVRVKIREKQGYRMN